MNDESEFLLGFMIEDPVRGIGKIVAGPAQCGPFSNWLVEYETWRSGHNAPTADLECGYKVLKRDYRHYWLDTTDAIVFKTRYYQINRDEPIMKVKGIMA